MRNEVMPMMCPICLNPICTNIGYNCHFGCVGNTDDTCLQIINPRTCHCRRIEIINKLIVKYPTLFNASDDFSISNETIKSMIVKIKLMDGKILDVDELFKEIEL